MHRTTMDGVLSSLKKKGYTFSTVIDVGASDGRWSESAMKYFPNAKYLLIEAQEVHRQPLTEFQTKHSNVRFVLSAAAERAGQIYFDASDPFGGQAAAIPSASHALSVQATTLDDEVARGGYSGPYLIKFDTHGYESSILRGAEKVLQHTDVIIMECYNFKIADESLMFYEMCAYLNELGFRCVDLADPMHRPYDGNFWQIDLVFSKKNRPEFQYVRYQ